MDDGRTFSAFAADRQIASGDLATVLAKLKQRIDRGRGDGILVFEDATGRQVDFNLEGRLDQILALALAASHPAGRGRPKLGVMSREVSLLPRHWEWLEAQPHGMSGAIRRLVDEAVKKAPGEARAHLAREAAHRFMTAMAGNRPGFEEALRALFAKDRERFEQMIRRWPADVRRHSERLADPSFLPG